ncbi:MAG: hemerythrin domain-containing protein [Hyphomicrobiaceae bacterium]
MMKTKPAPPDRAEHVPFIIDNIPLGLLDQPLEYIFADHARLRSVCAALQRFATEKYVTRGDADMVTAFLTRDRVLHEGDEDDDLFPAVSRRAIPEDQLGAVLARLRDDHRHNRALIDDITSALCRHPSRQIERLSISDRELMQSFAVAENRHIAIENNVVLAIARIRLPGTDLKEISRGMRMRRGLGLQ